MRALELQALQKFEKAQANKKKTQTFKKKNRNSGRCKNSRRHGLKQKWIINDTKFNNNNIKTKKKKKKTVRDELPSAVRGDPRNPATPDNAFNLNPKT